MTVPSRLEPALTLSDIFGQGVYCPRVSPNACRWISGDPALLNSLTANQLTVAGRMPVVCSRGAVGIEGLRLLREAGCPEPGELHLFSDGEEHLAQLRALAGRGEKLVLLHAHRPDDVPAESWWIPRELLELLNNKANLESFVAAGHAPRRSVHSNDALSRAIEEVEVPVVLKAGTHETTGAGNDVRICLDRVDLARAVSEFRDCPTVVAEEFLAIDRNLCLNYAVMTDGSVRYLGSAEQVCEPGGSYRGNWIDADTRAPDVAVALGEDVAMRGAGLGYRGIVGVDVAVLDDDRALAFDLNFRTNGSTTALLLHESIVRETGSTVMRLRSWTGTRGYGALLDAAYAGLEQGYFMPLASYDPFADGIPSAAPRLGGVLLGASRDEVREREAQFAALGLS